MAESVRSGRHSGPSADSSRNIPTQRYPTSRPHQYENPITGQLKRERYRTQREALLAWRDLTPAEKETHRLVSEDRGPYRVVIEAADLARKFEESQVGLNVYVEKEEYFRQQPELRPAKPDPGRQMRQLRPDELL